jgi:putative membrane-bound dehydrogenase-like protein
MRRLLFTLALLAFASTRATAGDGNRLAYLQECNPYYPSHKFPKLTTPQWVGEKGVEAVVILAIDDMKAHEPYERFLRPILNRLKKIDGRAPVSIMTCSIDPKDPHLQKWLKEGLSLECHTIDHPCPFFKGGFAKAKSTYERCVDLLSEVPGSKPVAFRMPCCDSLNTPSPRFYAEIFNKTTKKGHFLQIDSSVFNVFTQWDNELPRDLVLDKTGHERFPKYLPYDRSFVNTIENYPYPYVIDRLCWEFPCVTPSDWQAQHLHGSANPITLQDWKAALDCTVVKQGVFTMVFHPYGWSTPQQHVDFIDYAVKKYGKKVKFLTFREALERLNKNLLAGHSLRDSKTGRASGIEVGPGEDYVSVYLQKEIHDNRYLGEIRHWKKGKAGGYWEDFRPLLRFAALDIPYPVHELIVLGTSGNFAVAVDGKKQVVLQFNSKLPKWMPLPFSLPPGAKLPTTKHDSGLRFLDLDGDGYDDIVFSNEKEYGIYLFKDMKTGWSRKLMAGKAGDPGALPPIAKHGKNNGFWVHSKSLWWGNEDTVALKDHVARRSFAELLRDVQPGPRSPQESLKVLRPRPGFVAELVLAEPLVKDPIAFAWGPDGKLWVVEMGDYPLGVDGKGKPGGKIKYLESSKGDGHYDKMTVFLDHLPFPTGVLPWRKGVLVTCAPDIFYAEDTKGTGKADKKVILYTGFIEGNQQHRVNTLAWGLDNWIYCANGHSGGVIKSVKTGKTVNISGRDLRIRPDTGEIETVTGQTQYGRSRDDWGNWFGGDNSNPMWHYVLDDHYLRRNPHFAPPIPRVPVSVQPGTARVYPISRTLPRFNDPGGANRFTSACSPIVYRDELFGAFSKSSFVSEPVHNLVHREIIKPKGVTFTSRRAGDEEHSEFLESADNWFRPTMIQTGPDGALWVADMYRLVIEHPQWIPLDWQKKLDLRAGHDMGRIYRVYPEGKKPRAIPRLDKLDTAGLVAALDSPSGWQRDLAQMMLLWRADKRAMPALLKMTQAKRPLARLHALCTLDGLLPASAAQPASFLEELHKALTDLHPGVRKHAIRIAETRLAKASQLETTLLRLVDDPDPQVRMQLAYTLGEWDDPRAGEALGRLAVKDAANIYLTAAVMSSVNAGNLDHVLLGTLKYGSDRAFTTPPASVMDNLLVQANAFGKHRALALLLRNVGWPEKGSYAPWKFSTLAGLLDTLSQRNSSLAKLEKEGDEETRKVVRKLDGMYAAARKLAANAKTPPAQRAQAVLILGRGLDRKRQDEALLASLLVPQEPDQVQAAAVDTLGKLRDPEVPGLLLRRWKAYGPSLRSRVLDVLLSRPAWTTALLDGIEKKQVLPFEVDAARRQRLLDSKAADVRARAAKLFAGGISPDRQKVIDAYRAVLTLKGDPARGKALFAKNCAVCHRLAGAGNDVGPDLSGLTDKSSQALLVAVLDPNRAVEPRYINYVATTKDGLLLTGRLDSETGASITLIGPDGRTHVVLRADLEELVSTGKSVMPEGLEKDLRPQELADLFEYVRRAAVPEVRRTER